MNYAKMYTLLLGLGNRHVPTAATCVTLLRSDGMLRGTERSFTTGINLKESLTATARGIGPIDVCLYDSLSSPLQKKLEYVCVSVLYMCDYVDK